MAARGITTTTPSVPANLEAEQALLGCVIYDMGMEAPSVFGRLPDGFSPVHFFEPFHQRLFATLELIHKKSGKFDFALADGVFGADQGYKDLGGARYIFDLIDRAPPVPNAPDYAAQIVELSTRRRLLQLAEDIRATAGDVSLPVDDILTGVTANITVINSGTSALRLITGDEAIDSVMDYIDNPAGHAQGILTGLGRLDEHLGPWLPGDLIAIAGRPGAGKSAIAGAIATNVALAGYGVIEINAEMSVQQMWRRRMSAMAFQIYADQAPSYSKIRKRTLEFAEREMLAAAGERLRGLPIRSIKRSGITLGRMRALIQRQKLTWEREGIKLGLVTVDHGGIIRADAEYRSRVDEQTAISGGLKEMADADALDVAMLVLLQLNRKVEDREDKKPQLSDLRDSGSWEQDADSVIGAFREAYYAQREKEPPKATLKDDLAWNDWRQRRDSPWIDMGLLKVREGETGDVKLWANMRTNTILGDAPQEQFFGGFSG